MAALKAQPILFPFFTLLFLTFVTQLGSVAYNSLQTEQSFQSVVIPSIILLSVLTIPLGGLGLWLGRQVGLGAPLLADLLCKRSGSVQRLFEDAKLAIPLGLAVGAILVLIRLVTEPYLPPELPSFGYRGAIGGLLASSGAAVSEEVWFRLGVMTIFVWLFARLLGHKDTRPVVAWPIIVFVSLGFGLFHLPQLASYGTASPFAIIGTILGNSLVGILYGWFYWRRSLIAAIIAHFSVDLVIHVFPAFAG